MTVERRNDLWFKVITIIITIAGCFFGSYYGLVMGQAKLESQVNDMSARLDRVQAVTVGLQSDKVGRGEFQTAYAAQEKRADDLKDDLQQIKDDLRLLLQMQRASR